MDTPLLGWGLACPGRVPTFHLQEAARPWDFITFDLSLTPLRSHDASRQAVRGCKSGSELAERERQREAAELLSAANRKC